MLFMVIERFRGGSPDAVGDRFKRLGRMLPEGVTCHASWMESGGERCFQIMETSSPAALRSWLARWEDLVNFEIVPVVTSAEFWSESKA